MVERRKTLVLDAMGVIYKAGDDVAELLVPFLQAKTPACSFAVIEQAYERTSLGELPAEEFWRLIGLDPSLEDEYLLTHELTDGLLEFLPMAYERYGRILCLSNDVSEWSAKLRKRFGLEQFISEWFISGDMGVRKPSLEIYERMLCATGLYPDEVVFVDDRQANLEAAKYLGVVGVLFDSKGNQTPAGFSVARRLADVLAYA